MFCVCAQGYVMCVHTCAAAGDKLTGSFEADGCNLLLLTYSTVRSASAAAAAVNPATGAPLPLPPGAQDGAAVADTPSSLAAAAAASGGSAGGAAVGLQAAAAASQLPTGHGSNNLMASSFDAATSGSSSGSMLTLRLPFWLEFPSADDSSPAAASVMVTLLGPHRARVGQPVTLSWQLARIAAPDGAAAGADASAAAAGADEAGGLSNVGLEDVTAQQASQQQQQQVLPEPDELLCYELSFRPQQQQQGAAAAPPTDTPASHGQSGSAAGAAAAAASAAAAADMAGVSGAANTALCWGCSAAAPGGVVRLGRAPGSLAVVEVVLVPRATGRVAAPHLVLKSLGGNQVVLQEGGSGQVVSTVIISD
jgi:hypothetical protein